MHCRTPCSAAAHNQMEAPLLLETMSRCLELLKRALLEVMTAVPETGSLGPLQDAWEAVLRCALSDVAEAHHLNNSGHEMGCDLAALQRQVTQELIWDADAAPAPHLSMIPSVFPDFLSAPPACDVLLAVRVRVTDAHSVDNLWNEGDETFRVVPSTLLVHQTCSGRCPSQ